MFEEPSPPNAAAAPSPSSRVKNRFRIVRELGRGGMGIVYEARDEELGERIALKRLRDLTPESLVRFKREFRALKDVHHPHIVRFGDLIGAGGDWCFTMELVEGENFLSFVRAEGRTTFVEARVRSGLRQLALGLAALHGAGLVHRDVKPSNIRVDDRGRVVLIDFGLVSELDAHDSGGNVIVGTPAYMAPEQTRGTAGPEADMYALGVVLFEALTGRVPFPGTAMEAILSKLEEPAARVAGEVSGVPADLDEICARLLDRDPALRPTATELVQLLSTASERPPADDFGLAATTPFFGRKDELAALHSSLSRAREGEAVMVLVQGASGVGKTALAQQFVHECAEDPRTCVLTGRCYAREDVPYKALDGVIDSLTSFLLHADVATVLATVPPNPGPLTHVFPVLRRVASIAQRAAAGEPMPRLDPVDLRERAFASLRDLLARLGKVRTVVVVVEDLQWADEDSVTLLNDLLSSPEAPSLLFVGTARSEEERRAGTLSTSISQARPPVDLERSLPANARVLNLATLPHGDARALAADLLERAGAPTEVNAGWIAEEAHGHPLFVEALARYAALRSSVSPHPVRLDEALSAPLGHLAEAQQDLLALLAVSGRPLPERVLSHASALGATSFAKAVASLRSARLVASSKGRLDAVELFHDRIRATVERKLGRQELRRLHRRVAHALEAVGGADDHALALHWKAAGDAARASRHAVLAAEHASRSLAFDRAATLYSWALRGKDGSTEERAALLERMGEALACAGRGVHSAAAFEKASRGRRGAAATELRRRAAEQLLRSGNIDQGVRTMRGVLAELGLRLPLSRLAMRVYFLFWYLAASARGPRFSRRAATDVPRRQLQRIDAYWSLAVTLSVTDLVAGAAFGLRALTLALRAGEIGRIARALALQAAHLANTGKSDSRRVSSLAERAHALAKEVGDPLSLAWAEGARGIALYSRGHFRQALSHLRTAHDFSRESPGSVWELDTTKVFTVNTLAELGRLRELRAVAHRYLRETLERGDTYGAVNLRIGYANLRWLVIDRPEDAAEELDEAMAAWGNRGVHVTHFYELLARTNLALYTGEPAAALAKLDARWAQFSSALLFRSQRIRITALQMRARLALALGGEEMVKSAAADAETIARENVAWAAPAAHLIRATCAYARGVERLCARELRLAVAGYEANGMGLHAACARDRLGGIVGGTEGTALRHRTVRWMREEGVAAPGRLMSVVAPGFG